MTQDRDDKKTVGVTARGQELLNELMRTKWFDEEKDAYKLAIAVAVANDLQSPPELTGFGTKWSALQLDDDGRLGALVALMTPDEARRPFASCERRAAAAGLEFLKKRMVDEQSTLFEAMRIDKPEDNDSSAESI